VFRDTWSVKDGEVHVQPPVEVLESLLAIRIHLDAADEDNGALRVVPGSHPHGRLLLQDMVALRDQQGEVTCAVPPGGAMLMFPLLVHASFKSARPDRRRVVHLEYSALDLPGGLRWA
jgi:ectoine hydroxylase-related dioxygenase (phytanoyl-CoA dioxygenase family)